MPRAMGCPYSGSTPTADFVGKGAFVVIYAYIFEPARTGAYRSCVCSSLSSGVDARLPSTSQALRAACEERDSRISDLEVQALRNTSTLKMLSSALEVSEAWLLSLRDVQRCAGLLPLGDSWGAVLGR